MTVTYSWRGAGLIVLVIVPVVIALELILAVNLIGKEFVKEHFRVLVLSGIAISGAICGALGKWMNRERVWTEKNGVGDWGGIEDGSYHLMWGIPVQHWFWIYLALSIVLTFIWE